MLIQIMSLFQSSLILSCIPHGGARHIWDIEDPQDLAYTLKVCAYTPTLLYILGSESLQVTYVTHTLYPLIVTAIKSSILLLYLRLSPSCYFRRCVFALMGLCIVGGGVGAVVTVFQCKPISKVWNLEQPRKCLNPCFILVGIIIFNLATNIMIILLPMPTIWWLHMPIRRKVAFLCIFSIGFMQVCHLTGFSSLINMNLDLADP